MPDTTLTAIEFVKSRLEADETCAAENIVVGAKPPDILRGIIIRVSSGGHDGIVIGGHINMTDPTLSVLAFCEGEDPGALRDLSEAAFRALHRARGSVDGGGFVLNCLRVSPLYFTYRDGAGPTEQYLGGVYRLEIRGEG